MLRGGPLAGCIAGRDCAQAAREGFAGPVVDDFDVVPMTGDVGGVSFVPPEPAA